MTTLVAAAKFAFFAGVEILLVALTFWVLEGEDAKETLGPVRFLLIAPLSLGVFFGAGCVVAYGLDFLEVLLK